MSDPAPDIEYAITLMACWAKTGIQSNACELAKKSLEWQKARIKQLEFEAIQLKDHKLSPVCYEDGCNGTALYCERHATQMQQSDGVEKQ